MEQIGVWVTESGPVNATLTYGSEGQDDEFSLSGALQGAITGATTGAVAGPWGAVVGGLAGGAIGGLTTKPAPKPGAAPSARPSTPSTAARPAQQPATTSAQGAAVINALQQFAAIIPSLVQLASAGSKKEVSDQSEAAWGDESAEPQSAAEWVYAATESSWSSP